MNKKVTPIIPTVTPPDGLTLKHHSPSIGTEVLGVDLRQPLNEKMFGFLHQTLLERKVLFFRDQDITPEQHVQFARNWGELELIEFLPSYENLPELLTIRRGSNEQPYENVWHSDVSWREKPSFGSILRALKVPEVGGDTLFADMSAVYDALSPSMKVMLDTLSAVHNLKNLGAIRSQTVDPEAKEKMSVYEPQIHPVVRTHPETGKKILYVNGAHTDRIKGLSSDESRTLLGELYHYSHIPEFQCRFHWEANSIAFWDNRSTQHYAVADYSPQERFMDRATIAGDKPY
jgi:taurine dioxygenase